MRPHPAAVGVSFLLAALRSTATKGAPAILLAAARAGSTGAATITISADNIYEL